MYKEDNRTFQDNRRFAGIRFYVFLFIKMVENNISVIVTKIYFKKVLKLLIFSRTFTRQFNYGPWGYVMVCWEVP